MNIISLTNNNSITIKDSHYDDERLKLLLSFAIGAILGDVFFHLIPESYHAHLIEFNHSIEDAHCKVGLSIIAGLSLFIVVEMVLNKWSITEKTTCSESTGSKSDDYNDLLEKCRRKISSEADLKSNVGYLINLNTHHFPEQLNNNIPDDLNGNSTSFNLMNAENMRRSEAELRERQVIKKVTAIEESQNKKCNTNDISNKKDLEPEIQTIEPAGYLNLIANGFDNFTHGLAIGASFLVSLKVGLLTTFVIFIHEIPHEICDYAILVNSGFSRWNAVKAQSSVSLFGMLGTGLSLYVKSIETLNAKTAWILPFSAGGFLYIALVNLLPEILGQETKIENSLRQVACVISGVVFMATVAIF